jgi:hypothetical protein
MNSEELGQPPIVTSVPSIAVLGGVNRSRAHQDVFDYIEMLYNPSRKYARDGMLPPVEFERQQKAQSEGVSRRLGTIQTDKPEDAYEPS